MFRKKTLSLALLLIAACALLFLSACSTDPSDGGGTETPEGPVGKLTSGMVSFDFSFGSPDGHVETEIFHSYSESITFEEMVDQLSIISGLDFYVTLTYEDGRTIADWAADSTLIAGLDDREMREGYTFNDADSLRWFMMDSLWRTLGCIDDLYYTMDGGKELAFDELYPTNVFPADAPYMGSPFYFAHADVKGDDDDIPNDFVAEITYADHEYGLMLYYPASFAAQPENPGDIMLRFPSLEDDIVLQYWVTPNVYDETADVFANGIPGDDVYCFDNTVIAWYNDSDPATGDTFPIAYYWLVEEDNIACVAIICQTEEQAELWCGKLMVEDAVRIEKM